MRLERLRTTAHGPDVTSDPFFPAAQPASANTYTAKWDFGKTGVMSSGQSW